MGPPNAGTRDQPPAVSGQKQHERPGVIGSPDLRQANRLLMPAEQLHGACHRTTDQKVLEPAAKAEAMEPPARSPARISAGSAERNHGTQPAQPGSH